MGTMTRKPAAKGRAREPAVSYLGAGRIAIRGQPLFAEPDSPPCRRFIEAILRNKAVQQVLIHPVDASAIIDFGPGPCAPERLIQAVAKTLAAGPADSPQASADHLFLRPLGHGPIRITRLAGRLTTFEPAHRIPGRVRLRHPALLSRDRLCQALENELAAQEGVLDATASARTGSLVILFDEAAVDLADLLVLLEVLLAKGLPPKDDRGAEDLAFAFQGALAALSAASDYLFPPLAPVCAALILAANVPTFRKAADLLMRRRIGEEVVEAGFVLLAFTVSSFFSGQLLNWTFSAWPRVEAKTLRRYRRKLLVATWDRPAAATLLTGKGEARVASARLKPGDRIVVRAGMTLPVDGEVLEGLALVDESCFHGPGAPAEKTPGSTVFAACKVLRGELKVRATRTGQKTLAATLAAALCRAAQGPLPSLRRIEAGAAKFFPPTLIGGVLTLFWQGPEAAMAFLRPDFAHAPRLVPRLSLLAALARLARSGVFVRDAAAFERLAEVDCLVLREAPGLTTGKGLAALRDAAAAYSGRIVLVAAKGAEGQPERHKGVERVLALSAAARVALVERLAKEGRKIAYAGFGDEDWAALGRTATAVSLDGKEAGIGAAAQALVPDTNLGRLAALLKEARTHAGRIAQDSRVAVLSNFASQAGALLAEWSPMVSTLVSLLGATVVHGSGHLDLRALAQKCDGVAGKKLGNAATSARRTAKSAAQPA